MGKSLFTSYVILENVSVYSAKRPRIRRKAGCIDFLIEHTTQVRLKEKFHLQSILQV